MPAQAALDLCVCERNRSSDRQTSAHCSAAAAEGCEGGGSREEGAGKIRGAQMKKRISPDLCRKITAKLTHFKVTKKEGKKE